MIAELSADEARALLASIRKAFPSDKFFPSDGAIVGGEWFDTEGQAHPSYSIEGEEIARVFAGARHWTDISGDDLMRRVKAGLSVIHLTPEALAFYLPAYLSACLSLPPDPDIDIEEFLDCLIPRLTPPDVRNASRSAWAREQFPDTRTDAQRRAMDEDRRRRFQRLVGEFNDAQKSVIAAFLEEAAVPFYEDSFYKECGEVNRAKLAFDSFWFRFRKP